MSTQAGLQGTDTRLIVGDALAVLPTLEATSVDACVTDPPHGVLERQAWDVLPAADLWRAVLRVLVPGAPLIVIGAPRTYHWMVAAIAEAGFLVDDMAIWAFCTGRPPHLTRLKPAHAPILIARKSGTPSPLNLGEARLPFIDEDDRQQTRRADSLRALARRRPGILDASLDDNPSAREPFEPKTGRYPTNVLASEPIDPRCDRFFLVPKVRDAAAHVAAKPVLLLSHLVRAFVPPGGTVLDPFAGSGTTGVAAIATGRRAVLIERDPPFAEMAADNLAAARRGDFRLSRSAHHELTGNPEKRVDIQRFTSDHEVLPPASPDESPGQAHQPTPAPNADQPLRTADETSALLGRAVAPLTLVRWARAGRIPAVRAGRSWVFNASAVVAALSNHHAGGAAGEASVDVDQRGQTQQVRRPGLPGRSAQGEQAPPLQAGRRSRGRRGAGASVRAAGRRLGCAPRADQASALPRALGRAPLGPDQAARLSDLLGAPVHPLGQVPPRSEDV